MSPDSITFPYSAPFDTRMLAVDEQHTLHVEQVGRADGVPAVFLHGGPGSGCQSGHRRLFDPSLFRAVLFDQRGAGRSTPRRSLIDNTTPHLIADMERIRTALGIDKWMVVGGSWGALLGVAYAEAHPERVSALLLRAVFLGTRAEVDWAFLLGPQTFYPELWRRFIGLLPEAERGDPLAAYGRRLMDPDPSVHGPAAIVLHDYEQALSVLKPTSLDLPPSLEAARASTRAVPNTPFVEWHYFDHGCFLADRELLAGAARLAGIPGAIVQGRYDLLCPPETAHALARAWPEGELRIVQAAGHSLSEPSIQADLMAAIAEFGRRLT